MGLCPGKASPRSRRVGHAEIWLRTCQAEGISKDGEEERGLERWEDQQRPEQMREESERTGRGDFMRACWIIIRMWDLLLSWRAIGRV